METNFAVQRITEDNPTLSTFTVENFNDAKEFYNAVMNCDQKLSSKINEVIKIKNVFMTMAEVDSNNPDGEPAGKVKTVRTVIMTDTGECFMAHSEGIAKSLYNLFTIFGYPDCWEEPIAVRVKQIETNKGRYFKLEVV